MTAIIYDNSVRTNNRRSKKDAGINKTNTQRFASSGALNRGKVPPLHLVIHNLRRLAEKRKRLPLLPLFPLPDVDLDYEAILGEFWKLAEEDDRVNPTGIAPEALVYMLPLLPERAAHLKARGRLSEEAIISMTIEAWHRLYGYRIPARMGVDLEVVDQYMRIINTARILLLALRATLSPSSSDKTRKRQ